METRETAGAIMPSVAPAGIGRAEDRFRARLSRDLGAERYERYFDPSTRISVEDGRVAVTVASGFLADLLDRRFGPQLREAAAEAIPDRVDAVQVCFRVESGPGAAGRGAERSERRAEAIGAAASGVRPEAPGERVHAGAWKHRLEDFLVGGSNKLAYASAVDVAGGGRGSGGPLFVHGACGLGKTHLLQGIAARMGEARPGAAVKYTTAEAFTNAFIGAVRTNRVDAFRRAFRRVELLCIDDVHFLTNKEATQEELVHTLDAVSVDGARIVLASDEHPREIRRLNQRLVSRCMAGVVVRIDPPDGELRRRLVRALGARRGLRLEDAAVELIVERSERSIGALGGFGGSVREIEGLLIQVDAVNRLLPEFAGEDGSVGVVLVRKALGLSEEREAEGAASGRPMAIEAITAEACRALRVDVVDLMGRGRHRRVVLARALVVYLARRHTTLSFPEIARAMGRPNHSTVITAEKRFLGQLADESAGRLAPEVSADAGPGGLRDLCERVVRSVRKAG